MEWLTNGLARFGFKKSQITWNKEGKKVFPFFPPLFLDWGKFNSIFHIFSSAYIQKWRKKDKNILFLKENSIYEPSQIWEFYIVTQSYADSFRGDVVLDSFNNVSRDEYNILYQIYVKQMCSDFSYEDLKSLE